MGYTRDIPKWKEMVDKMVNEYTLDECKALMKRYMEKGVQLGIQQVEEVMQIRVRKGIDPWDPAEVKSGYQTRHAKLVDGKFVNYVPIEKDFGAMHACLGRM